MTLPTYIEAMKPQKSVGSCWISSGPGVTPCTIIAASSSAAIGPAGTPSASMGTKAPDVAALLADSGPGHAGHRALAELLRVLRDLAARPRRRRSVEMTCAEPGMMPMRKPSTVPRQIGVADSRHSWRDGSRSRSRGRMTCGGVRLPRGEQDLGEAEEPDGHRHHADAVAELGHAVGEAEVAAHLVDADHAEEQPERGHGQRPSASSPSSCTRARAGRAAAARSTRAARSAARTRRAAGPGTSARPRSRCPRRRSRPPRWPAPAPRGPCAPSRSRRCTSSPRRPRRGCASGSTSSSRRTWRRSRCRRA